MNENALGEASPMDIDCEVEGASAANAGPSNSRKRARKECSNEGDVESRYVYFISTKN